MKIRYDKEADALYVTFGEDTGVRGIVERSERIPNTPITIDYDTEGKVFGIEIFDLSVCTQTDFAENFVLHYADHE